MAGMHSGYSPDLVYTKLDELFFSVFNKLPMVNFADIDQGDVFKQDTTRKAKVVTELMADAGLWESRTELQDVPEGTVLSGDSRNFNVVEYAKALKISKNFFDDEDFGAVRTMIVKMAQKGHLTKRQNGFDIFNGGFATHVTNDAAYIFSNSHTNLNGDTIDNLLTAALAPAALKSAKDMLIEQKDEAGDIIGYEPRVLLVPNALYDTAIEVTESKLKADTTDNNINTFSAKYNIYVKQSNYLSAAAGGSDTAWFLLADNHTVTRWIRQEIQTDWIDYKYDDKNRYTFKGNFREVYGAVTYEGLVGSTGLT